MADRVVPGPVSDSDCIREAVCIDTRKIFDSCRDSDCIEDLLVIPTLDSQEYIESALSVRPRSAELLSVLVNVEEVAFHRGYYSVDVSYFYKVKGETFPDSRCVEGLAIFDKRVMLFGGEGRVKSFSSVCDGALTAPCGLPVAIVQTVDPVALHMHLETADSPSDIESRSIPDNISGCFDSRLSCSCSCRQWYVTLGQFSIIRLERDSQLLIPAYDYCIPDKECVGSSEDDPCTMFSRIRFPIDDFFPPDSSEGCDCSDTDS